MLTYELHIEIYGFLKGVLIFEHLCFHKIFLKLFIILRAVARSENPGGGARSTVLGIICPPSHTHTCDSTDPSITKKIFK